MTAPLAYAIERVQAVLDEIERLKDGDFPYDDSRDALDAIDAVFKKRMTSLRKLTEDHSPDVVHRACAEALEQAMTCLPLLGFILRSTNVRNSFEIFAPLKRLAAILLANSTKLLLSSEWEFSPYVYRAISVLPNFVLLGLPASESANPLLVPLAGHEFGHAVWYQQSMRRKFEAAVREHVLHEVKKKPELFEDLFGSRPGDLFADQPVSLAYAWTIAQIEETFCDCLGARLFSESYLHAFAYLIAPGFHAARSPRYPSIAQRVSHLVQAAESFAVEVPENYQSWFDKETTSLDPQSDFLLDVADRVAAAHVKQVIDEAREIADTARAPIRSQSNIERALKCFALMAPASGIGDLTSILNAAWAACRDESLWVDSSIETSKRRFLINELVLKSIEVLEFEKRTAT